MELVSRYAYRDEFLPLLCAYLGVADRTRILDVGAGSAFLARTLARALDDVHVTALEADARMLEIGRRLVHRDGMDGVVEVVSGDAYELPFERGRFDAVTSHLVMCILNDPATALREQIRVTRPGGTVSAAICFCRTDRLPSYHGRWGLPGDHRIDTLHRDFERAWRRGVRPGLLDLDHDVAPQDLAWHFRDAGLQNIQVNGHLATVSPGDDRLPRDEARTYSLARMERDVLGLQQRWAAHATELDRAGFPQADYQELLQLAKARFSAARSDPDRALRAMEVRVEAMLFVRGTVPLAP